MFRGEQGIPKTVQIGKPQWILFFFTAILFFADVFSAHAGAQIHHEMQVVVTPGLNRITVVDKINFSPDFMPDEAGKYHFSLHAGLIPIAFTPGVVIEPESGPETDLPVPPQVFDMDMKEGPQAVPVTQYAMTLPIGLRQVIIGYEGMIFHPVSEESRPDRTTFPQTSGMISEEGLFLAGQSHWYPDFGQNLLSFTLNISLPQGWHAVSQGEQKETLLQGQNQHIRWQSTDPQEQIFLAGGKWTEYQRKTGRVLIQVFLKSPDPALANTYLKSAEQYLTMYQKLLGPYPYQKFALLENFWESAYSVPSFTLMGPKTLQNPATIDTLYPHEILRNWWGNSVFVDQKQGNWSEGLTAYLSDYLKQEQKDTAQSFRLTFLQEYAQHVSPRNDIPLSLIHPGQGPIPQAIGYGKALMLFHMFRQTLGDARFIEALRTFYQENRFRHTGYEALAHAFNRAEGKPLSNDFMDWVTRTGAPSLRARQVASEKTDTGYLLTAVIEQRQPGPPYPLNIPIAVTLQGQKQPFQTTVVMQEKSIDIEIDLPRRPVRLLLDPEYDLFRALHPSEMPPTIEGTLNAESTLILLPSTAPIPLRRSYQKLARSMKQDFPDRISIGWDNEYPTLPDDRSVLLLGWENRFQRTILKELVRYNVSTNSAMTRIGDIQIPRRRHSIVFAARHPKKSRLNLSWLATDQPATIPILGTKLPKYGPYGYLAFQGETVKNIEKGRWPPVGSPMSIRIKQADGRWIKEVPTELVSRQALTTVPPLFSEERLRRDIAFLSSSHLKGRGFGTPELDRAAEYIASIFREAGLIPADDSGRSFIQQWQGNHSGLGSGISLKNVVGLLPGTGPGLEEEYIVIGAHYDHLGFGWPRVHEGDESTLHPGANANASGVALMLELARVLKKDKPLKRPILFVAFTAKEIGLRGSEYFVSDQKSFAPGRISLMINLDTVGQMRENRLYVLGTGSSREWPPILRRVGFETGVEITAFPEVSGTSDHISFIKAGIPAIQFFTGITPETDRPTDTIQVINFPGMLTVGRVAQEVVTNLANHPVPLSTGLGQKSTPSLIWERRDISP